MTWTFQPFVIHHRELRKADAQEAPQLPPEEKVSILRRHLIDPVPVSDLCDEYQLQPRVFYEWQKLFFESGAAALGRQHSGQKAAEASRIQQLEERLQRTEEKLQRKHEVLSELVEEHVKLKKELGEL